MFKSFGIFYINSIGTELSCLFLFNSQLWQEKEKVADIPFKGFLALNKPEWPYLVVGLLASFVGGAVYPCVAILFAKIIGVRSLCSFEFTYAKKILFFFKKHFFFMFI